MNKVSRRTLLHGIGATVTLPWMESIAGAEERGNLQKPPVRFGTLIFANGVNPYHWWAKGGGDNMELSPTLAPLAPFRRDITVLNELHVFNNTSGPHWPLFSNMLSGAQFQPSLVPRGAESIDQLISRQTGRQTSVPSLVLAVEPAESGLRGGVPSIYYGTVSWSSPNTPIPPEIYPRAVFDRLFDTSGLLRDRSVLDAVLEQAKDIRRNLATSDRQKLDEFSTSVRELEQRIERAASQNRLEGWMPSLIEPDMDRPPESLPQDVREHMRMMLDLLLLSWRMDKTRVATLIFNRDVSHMKFGFLDGVLNDQLHGISHHKEDQAKLKSYQRINRFHVEQFAYLLSKMKQVDEGAGTTLLDNVILLFGSNMFNGDSHDGRNLPLILAGHAGGQIPGGRVIDFADKPEEQQRACNLYVSIAQMMGLRLDRFGDSIGPLAGLS